MNSSLLLENVLQKYRFGIIRRYLHDGVLDFGGNKGELVHYIDVINYYDEIKIPVTEYYCTNNIDEVNGKYDVIVCLAVIEHIKFEDVFIVMRKLREHLNDNGKIILTTPSEISKPVLEFLAFIRVLDKENIEEHKHYWNKEELEYMSNCTGYSSFKYKSFQFGFNQLVLLNK